MERFVNTFTYQDDWGYDSVGEEVILIGSARECRSLYRNLWKRWIAYCTFVGDPEFNPYRVYGIRLDYVNTVDGKPSMTVMGETQVSWFLLNRISNLEKKLEKASS